MGCGFKVGNCYLCCHGNTNFIWQFLYVVYMTQISYGSYWSYGWCFKHHQTLAFMYWVLWRVAKKVATHHGTQYLTVKVWSITTYRSSLSVFMTKNTPSGNKKHRESTEPESRQTERMFISGPAHHFFPGLKSHETIRTAHWGTMVSLRTPFFLHVYSCAQITLSDPENFATAIEFLFDVGHKFCLLHIQS